MTSTKIEIGAVVDLSEISVPWSRVESVDWVYPDNGAYLVRFASGDAVAVLGLKGGAIATTPGIPSRYLGRMFTHIAGPLLTEDEGEVR